MHHNQDPKFYSKEYYLKGCAGYESFRPGEESNHEIFRYIQQIVGEFKGKRVLDLGCGRGELVVSSAKQGASYALGVDFSPDAIEIANESKAKSHMKNIDYKQADVLQLELDQKFDLIFLTDIVEHLYDEQNQLLFKKVKQWLNPKGIIIVHTMPTTDFIEIGQYFKAISYYLRGKRYDYITYADQNKITHVNLQNKEKLESYLRDYQYTVWYDFAYKSFLRACLKRIIPARYLASNLWAKITL